MTEVEVGLVTVLGDEDLAVLKRAHGARVDVEVRIGLLHGHLVATRLEKATERSRSNALTQGRHDATGDEHVLGHIWLPALSR